MTASPLRDTGHFGLVRLGLLALAFAAILYAADRRDEPPAGLMEAAAPAVAHAIAEPAAGALAVVEPDRPAPPDDAAIVLGDTGVVADDQRRRSIAVRRGDTLMDILLQAGLPRAEAHEAVSTLASVFDPRALKPGQEITFTFATAGDGGSLVAAALSPTAARDVGVIRGADGKFNAFKLDKPLTRELARSVGTVRTSLFEAGQAAGLPIGVLSELIRAFSFDVDFQREVQPGDSFDVVFERFRDEEGKPVKDGAVVFAALALSGKTHRLWRHVGRDGFADFYSDKGESVRKALLKTPIDGAKLTSRFGSRTHPILGYTAKHKGADFGAATGTPIQAAGDGTVETAGWQGSYGNYVRLRHNSEFATAYGHMSRIAVKPGTRVRQGQVIGFVGATGMATGPHLHYEVIRRGAQVNPMGVQLPSGRRLEGGELIEFRQARARTDATIAAIESDAKPAQTAEKTR